jgi:hypothetical protein
MQDMYSTTLSAHARAPQDQQLLVGPVPAGLQIGVEVQQSSASPMDMARPISTPRNMVLRNDVIHTTQSSLRTCSI